MTLPLFSPGDDPGPDFAALQYRLSLGGARRPVPGTGVAKGLVDPGAGAAHEWSGGALSGWDYRRADLPIRHGTTVVALRFADGVVIAGDRRATEGHLIAYRSMEKVFPADSHSAVAIAGAAGPAVEMIRLFQVQLEHYEKVEGVALTLEGKANQLGQMVAGHLPMAMQGLAVVPLFAGYDLGRRTGRIFSYDLTGGHYEEPDHAATGSGGRDARTAVKARWREGLPRHEAVELAVAALFEAADEDIATGGPDLVRGIYPVVATVTGEGYERVGEDEVSQRFARVTEQRSLGRAGGAVAEGSAIR